MTTLYIILALIAFPWLVWREYVMVMGLYRAKLAGTLSQTALVLGAPDIFIGVVSDWVLNLTYGRVVFGEWPLDRKELLTQRLTRYLAGPECRNKHRARIICRSLLDPFDPTGKHCE